MPPFMGLTSYAAFTTAGGDLMLMGDTVLLEDEVDAAMSAAVDAGLEVTALHSHFSYDQPRVWFMHIGGMGDARRLAPGVKALYDRIAQVRAAQATPAQGFAQEVAAPSSITAAPLEAILGAPVQSQGGMAKATIGREARMHGTTVGNEIYWGKGRATDLATAVKAALDVQRAVK